MLGLINSAIEGFVRETYGTGRWREVQRRAGFGFDRFEPLMTYDPKTTDMLLSAATGVLDRPRDAVLEDMGHWLVAARSGGRLRRLLRFGGVGFVEFLQSLEDLPARARLALAELDLPPLHLMEEEAGLYRLRFDEPFSGAGAVLSGVLRSMADDYGVLALIDWDGAPEATITIHILSEDHGEAREFDLVHPAS